MRTHYRLHQRADTMNDQIGFHKSAFSASPGATQLFCTMYCVITVVCHVVHPVLPILDLEPFIAHDPASGKIAQANLNTEWLWFSEKSIWLNISTWKLSDLPITYFSDLPYATARRRVH